MGARIGKVAIVFGTSGFTGEILDVTPPNTSRESIETTHQLTTGNQTFMPADNPDPGELSFDMHHDPTANPPINAPAETITLTYTGDGTTEAFTGFMTGYDPTAPVGGKMTAGVKIKVSGNIVRDPLGAGCGSGSFFIGGSGS